MTCVLIVVGVIFGIAITVSIGIEFRVRQIKRRLKKWREDKRND